MKNEEYSLILGIGGGKTLDSAKAIGHYTGYPVYLAPTSASTDAPTSAIAVLYKASGEFDVSLDLKENPRAVIVDEEVIVNAPVRLFNSGIGDALATFYEADATRRSNSNTRAGGKQGLAAKALSDICIKTILEEGVEASKDVEQKSLTEAVSNVIEANTLLSGLGFESGGLAAAHAINNGMTVIEELNSFLHGEKVAFGTLVQIILEDRPKEELYRIIEFCKELNLPTNFSELGIPNISREEILKCARLANSERYNMKALGFEVRDEDIVSAMYTLDNLSMSM